MALCCVIMIAQTVKAQQNMCVVGNDGKVNVFNVSSVDYATFNADEKWFTISNDGIERADTTFITADCTVALSSESNVKTLSVTPKVGVCYSKDNTTPTEDDDCKWLGSSLKSYTFSLSSLIPGTTYYYRVYVKLGEEAFYGDVCSAQTTGTKPADNSKTIDGHRFIDLGLPSGLLWAETNIGAETAADDGDYYAWGETTEKEDYDWDTYKYGTSSSDLTKYNKTDGKTVLDKEDDAAYVNWGSSCRMPTDDDFTELKNSGICTWRWKSKTTSSGSSISGYKVTSKKNGNSIFLPASGGFDGSYLYGRDSNGYYWSSTLSSSDVSNAYDTRFTGNYVYYPSYGYAIERCDGHTVRPVAEPVTFKVNDITISNDGIESATTNSITATCSVGLSSESNVKTLSVTPQVGVCYSKYNSVPTIDDDDCLSLGSELKSYMFTLKSLTSGTTYYFRTYVKLGRGVFYGDVANAKTLGTAPVDKSKTINGHRFVDLGLPSGLLWAKTNIGAETAADDGNYYAWGETSTKDSYSWVTYKYGTSSSNLTKYNETDGKTILDKEDDAAYINWGSPCRMPTKTEFAELRNSDNCTWTWTSMTTSSGSSISGYKVTSKKNGNSIFLPVSGDRYGSNLDYHGWYGNYWSSTLYSSNVSYAYHLTFDSIDCYSNGFYYRYYGFSVRPVTEP